MGKEKNLWSSVYKMYYLRIHTHSTFVLRKCGCPWRGPEVNRKQTSNILSPVWEGGWGCQSTLRYWWSNWPFWAIPTLGTLLKADSKVDELSFWPGGKEVMLEGHLMGQGRGEGWNVQETEKFRCLLFNDNTTIHKKPRKWKPLI